ncbi:MAG: SMP-30/gluconolactonase/LRE family protein, partial [Verrucomicrobia bacterium]|nr:SMP-30/gluconolactonase/LRE family protein [Verrucomicrobiota bacterium]
WFTDPDYGVPRGKPSPQGGNFIYRFDPKTTNTTRLAGPFERPSGICFSPDESILYFSDSGVTNVFHHIHSYQVKGDGSLADVKTVVRVNPGNPGTLRCDEDGRLWTTAANGIHVYKSDGSAVGQIGTALSPAGFCWGGDEGRTMYIVARRYLYSIETKVRWSGWRSAGPARQVPNQPAASVAP